MDLLRYIGIINGLFLLVSILILASRIKGFNFGNTQISKLGTYSQTGRAFSLVFGLFSFNQLIFLYQLLRVLNPQPSPIIWLPLAIASLAGMFVSFSNMDKHPHLHGDLGMIAFPFTCLGGVLFGLYSISTGQLSLGVPGLIISLVMFLPLVTWFKNRTVYGVYELVFFLCMLLWNSLYTLPLVF